MNQAVQLVRNPPPRMLTLTETLHSLNHWKTCFRTYYRRDTYFKGFLLPTVQWDPSATNYGLRADIQGEQVVRSAEDKCEDLKDFLNTLVGYLPFPYLTEKIVNASRNLQEIWEVIYEHYGLNICISGSKRVTCPKILCRIKMLPSIFYSLANLIQH